MSSLRKAGEELEKAADAGVSAEGVQNKAEEKVESKDAAENDAKDGQQEGNKNGSGSGEEQKDGYAPVDVRI